MVGAEGDRKEHHVTLIALDVLQVLDDHGLFAFVLEETISNAGVLPSFFVEQIKDKFPAARH